jgi:hypothetical protein
LFFVTERLKAQNTGQDVQGNTADAASFLFINMELNHILPLTQPQPLDWAGTSFEQSLVELSTFLLEEAAVETLEVGISTSLQTDHSGYTVLKSSDYAGHGEWWLFKPCLNSPSCEWGHYCVGELCRSK